MAQAINTLGIVLSGGAGTRVGGQDKGLLPYRGQPVVQHVLSRFAPQVDQIMISIHRNEDQYLKFGFPLAMDDAESHQGPMMGVVSALTHAMTMAEMSETTQHFVIAPCDAPHLPKDYVQRLKQAIEKHSADCAVSYDGTRRQNLHCLFSIDAAQSLITYYQSGGRAMHQWFSTVHTVEADFSSNPSAFQNLNTLSQFNS